MNLQYIYTPGAGKMPKFLAGRDKQIDEALSAFEALRDGEAPLCIAYSGYRGVGKTVLLNKLLDMANEYDILGYHIEVREDGSLIPRLLTHCRDFMYDKSGLEKLKVLFQKGANAMRSLEVSFSPDSGAFSVSSKKDNYKSAADYSQSLENLFEVVGAIAKEKHQPLCFFIDEFQYANLNEMDAFLGALHRIAQLSCPVMAIVAGTPEMIAKMYERKTYVERLFIFPDIMLLSQSDVNAALSVPGEKAGLTYDDDAVKFIFDLTEGYPYFVQVYGQILCGALKNEKMPYNITAAFAKGEYSRYIQHLDENFYKIRFNNRSSAERDFLFAMASLQLPCSTNDVAHYLNKTNKQIAPTLAKLKAKGIVANDNGLRFTVPGFTDYLNRHKEDYIHK